MTPLLASLTLICISLGLTGWGLWRNRQVMGKIWKGGGR